TPEGETVTLAALPQEIRERMAGSAEETKAHFQEIHDLRVATQQYEAAVIKARMSQFHGNRLLVAESLNIPKRTLDHKCQKLEVN
ncbi:sigma-54-dependent Fis family transcriptional regulator, partial [Candidatus Symbiopectobacterium sp. NZEC135]|nr:sigma-54-dependent Fis family transcriptional regulator [Candidatus Symbiopectobacterium sp. NZEC135]